MAWTVSMREPVRGTSQHPGAVYGVVVADDDGVIRMTLGYDTKEAADTAAEHIRDALAAAVIAA